MIGINEFCIILRGKFLLPNHIRHKIPSPKHLIHQHLEVMAFVVVNRHPDTAVFTQQLAQQLQAWQHHGKPLGVLQVVVVMFKRTFGVVGRVNKNAFDLAPIKRKQGFEGL